MFIYCFVFILLLLFAYFKPLFDNKSLRLTFFVFLAFFLCCGYMVGSDWRAYEYQYTLIAEKNANLDDFKKEPGLLVLFYVAYFLHIDFWILWIIIKIFCFYVTIKVLNFYSNGNYSIALLFFICYCALFYYIDNPMRNLISSVIFMGLGYKYIYEKKILKFLGVVLLASFFHLSVLLLLPVYFIPIHKVISPYIVFPVLCVFVLLGIWGVRMSDLFVFLNEILFNLTGEIRLYGYLEREQYGVSLGIIFLLLLYCFAYFRRKFWASTTKYSFFLLNLGFCCCVYLLIGVTLPILFRTTMFVFVPYILIVSFWLMKEKDVILKVGANFIVCIFLGYVVIANITSSYKYIPYTNYCSYIFKEKPSYRYRSMYNYEESPYNKRNK